MEDTRMILDLFESQEQWNAYIELANMKQAFTDELKERLSTAMQKLTDRVLAGSGWRFACDRDHLAIFPLGTEMICITIEWGWWNDVNSPWGHRSAFLWVNYDALKDPDVKDKIRANKAQLPLSSFEESDMHNWLPFVHKIPAAVFNVPNETTLMEQCLYEAKDHADRLAENIWDDVFAPFANPECAEILTHIVSKNQA